MTQVHASSTGHEVLFVEEDAEHDFMEISCLLDDVNASHTSTDLGLLGDGLPSQTPSSLSLPEFAVVSPNYSGSGSPGVEPVPTLSLSSNKNDGEAEPARVSPSPSLETLSQAHVHAKTHESTPNKKRKISILTDEAAHPNEDRKARQKIRRREKNREHAKRSRSKKKDFVKHLEESVVVLKEENAKLRQLIQEKLQLRQEDTEKMIQEYIQTPTERFIAALKKPSNRVLSNSAVTYLQSFSSFSGSKQQP